MPETTKVFLTLDVDLDDIPQKQEAIDASAVVAAIEAAPASVSYITCGTGANISVDALPIGDLASSNLDITGKILTTGDLVVKNDLTVQGTLCPIPLPFGYVQCDDPGTNSTDEQNFGLGATITSIESNSDDITWDDNDIGGKYFVVAKVGTYELLANLVVDAGSQSEILTVKAKVNGVAGLTILPRIYGNVGPVERTFQCVLTATAGQNITISLEMGSTKTIHLETGSTFTLRRLK